MRAILAREDALMPVHRIKKGCYKYGKSGKTYCGSGAKSNAAKQGRAIKASQAKRKKG